MSTLGVAHIKYTLEDLLYRTRTLTSIARIHSHTYINTVTATLCEALAQLLHNFGIEFFILKVPEGRGSKPVYPVKTPKILPANRYHIFEEKLQRPGLELNPHPPTLVINSLGQDIAPSTAHGHLRASQLIVFDTTRVYSPTQVRATLVRTYIRKMNTKLNC